MMNNSKFTRICCTSAMALGMCFLLTSCEKPKVVELAVTSDATSVDAKANTKKNTTRAKQKEKTTQQRSADSKTSESKVLDAKTSDIASMSPVDIYKPVIIEGLKLVSDTPANDKDDGLGGRAIVTNGMLKMDHVIIPYNPKSVTIEARGSLANGIGPKFMLRLVNEESKNTQTPWGEDCVISNAKYERAHRYVWQLQENPFVAGPYTVQLFYMNNSEGMQPGSTEDRNLFIKSIEFHP